MTALNVFVQPKARAGYIVVDAAFTSDDGCVTEIGSKVVQGGGRFPWALGVTGNVSAVAVGRELLTVGVASLKQLERRLIPAMHRAIAATAAAFPDTPLVNCGVRGVAWDFAAKKPIGFTVMSHPDLLIPGAAPFTFYRCDAMVTCDHVDGLAGLLGRPLDLVDMRDPERFAADTDGLALIEAQRRTPYVCTIPGVDASVKHRIGGEAHLVTVTRHGVRIEGLREWSDRIGERIMP